jgi:hypothetical protein
VQCRRAVARLPPTQRLARCTFVMNTHRLVSVPAALLSEVFVGQLQHQFLASWHGTTGNVHVSVSIRFTSSNMLVICGSPLKRASRVHTSQPHQADGVGVSSTRQSAAPGNSLSGEAGSPLRPSHVPQPTGGRWAVQ